MKAWKSKTTPPILAASLLAGVLFPALADEPPGDPRPPESSGLFYSGPAAFTLPFVLPFESAIGRRHLDADDTLAGHGGPAPLVIEPGSFQTNLSLLGFLPPGIRSDLLSLRWSFFAAGYNVQVRATSNDPSGNTRYDDQILEIYAGLPLRNARPGWTPPSAFDPETAAPSRPPVNLLLGLTTRARAADVIRNEELATIEYGTVFLAPGLQLAGRRMLFEATVELPLRRPSELPDRYRDRLRGNIGMKYFLR